MIRKPNFPQFCIGAILVFSWFLVGCAKRDAANRSVDHESATDPSFVKTVEISTSSGIAMMLIPAGKFMMGSSKSKPDEGPSHEVFVSTFAMDKFEVTQEQFASLELPDPSQFKDESGQRPVEQVRWSDAALYCNERSRAEGLEPCYDEDDLEFKCNFEASGYRLPTEAEWEYAARAGTSTTYDFGNAAGQLKNYACYAGNSRKKTDIVGRKKPNAWGLYDIYGNVSEWCNDRYHADYYQDSPTENPRGPVEGNKRVLRGGAWNSNDANCRVTIRHNDVPGYADACFARNSYGFRCVRRLSLDEIASVTNAISNPKIEKP